MWPKARWMGYSVRLELMRVWMVYSFVWVYIEVTPSFLQMYLLLHVLPLISLWYFICFRFFVVLPWVIVCMCLSVKVVSDSTKSYFFFCLCVWLGLVFFCSVVWNLLDITFYWQYFTDDFFVYIYIYMYVCFHMRVCIIYISFNVGLNLSQKFFLFIWSNM